MSWTKTPATARILSCGKLTEHLATLTGVIIINYQQAGEVKAGTFGA